MGMRYRDSSLRLSGGNAGQLDRSARTGIPMSAACTGPRTTGSIARSAARVSSAIRVAMLVPGRNESPLVEPDFVIGVDATTTLPLNVTCKTCSRDLQVGPSLTIRSRPSPVRTSMPAAKVPA
jgi:hypothetical protein